MSRHDPDPEEGPEPPRLKRLRWLVNALTLTLILGVITIVALLVIRLGPAATPVPLPAAVALPAGERAEAVTVGDTWLAVVTTDAAGRQRIRILDRTTGVERGTTEIAPAASVRATGAR